MTKVEELAIQLGMTALGIIWALGGDSDIAENRAREILSCNYDIEEMRKKVEEVQKE